MCEWCSSGVLWGAALQRKLTSMLRRPPVLHPPTPMPELPQKNAAYRHHSQRRHWRQVGITPPPVAVSGAALTCVCGCAEFWGDGFFWRPVRPGSAHRQPDWLTRPDFFLRGHGRDGGGWACEKDGQGRPWEGVREGKMGKDEGKIDEDMTEGV